MFFLLPLTYYILEYALTVYTNLLYTGKAVIIEFMDSFIVVLYFFLSIVTLSMSNKKNTAERENIILSAAAAQAEKEISQLTDYQKQAAIYRHDLRHHMNFIQSCLAGNNTQQALEYINEINNNLDNTRITRYCSNKAINLILSSYINKAHDADISTQISVTATNFSSYRITDLCSLLANALENAINSCIKQCDNAVSKDNKRLITIKLFEKNNKICINIANTYFKEPRFHNQIPVTDEPDHGIGVRSIISVIEKYNGIYAFFTKDGTFYFQACI